MPIYGRGTGPSGRGPNPLTGPSAPRIRAAGPSERAYEGPGDPLNAVVDIDRLREAERRLLDETLSLRQAHFPRSPWNGSWCAPGSAGP